MNNPIRPLSLARRNSLEAGGISSRFLVLAKES